MAIQPDGRIVAAGTVRHGLDWDMGLARYNSDGSLDHSFGIGGLVAVDFAGSTDDAHAVAMQADGKIVIAGDAYRGTTEDLALARLEADGSLDRTFGHGGRVAIPIGENATLTTFWDVAVQADGKIVAAGQADVLDGTGPHPVVVRVLVNGSLDGAFAVHGHWVDHSSLEAQAVAIQSDERIVVAGIGGSRGGDFYLARLNTDGSLDFGFGTNGRIFTDFFGCGDLAFDVLVQPDGDLVVGGHAATRRSIDFALARYLADGSPDPTFGTGGLVTTDIGPEDTVFGLGLQADGKIVAAGLAFNAIPGGGWAAARYDVDGSLDTTFGAAGIVLDTFAGHTGGAFEGVAVQADGRIVAAGYADGPVGSPNQSFAVARYLG